MKIRPRRLRCNELMREMVRETRVSSASLIYPVFVEAGENKKTEITSIPGQYRYTLDRLNEGIEEAISFGVFRFMLFGIPAEKDERGSGAYEENGIIQRAVGQLKKTFGDRIQVITDVCLCEYTSHGHCGVLCEEGVANDETLEIIGQVALSHAKAGCDMVAPSDMMDGDVGHIREVLDQAGFTHIPIMSYSVKYASAFYGPFREAAGSKPQFGDRNSYQMDFHNQREALKEVDLDLAEGTDFIMVKPALSYLDVISRVKERTNTPLVAYSVSGEYAMIKACASQGLMDEHRLMCETAISIFRAGADILITYYAKELAQAIRNGDIG